MSVEQRIFGLARKILAGAANRNLTPDLDLVTDLNADSLSQVSLLYAMEEEFGFAIGDLSPLVMDSRTLGDLVAAVEERLKS